MPDLAFGFSAYRRDNGGLPEFKLINMFVEKTPAAANGLVIISRNGLVEEAERGEGPIRGLFAKRGVFDFDLFAVSNLTLYRGATALGSLTGSGSASFASSSAEVVVTLGGTAYSYDGSTLAAITFPDSADVTAVAFIAGLFVYARAGTGRFYWSAVLDGRTIDGLDYATAESSPDEIYDIFVVQDGLWLLGSGTVEFWQVTGAADAPFSRVEGRLYKRGVIGTGCAADVDNTLIWWGDNNVIYRGAEVPQRLSDHALEEKLATSSERACFAYEYEGHEFFVVRTDDGSFAFDVSTGQWFQPDSDGRVHWRPRNAAVADVGLVFGDDEDGTLWKFDNDNWDDGGTMRREFTAAFPLSGGQVRVDRLCVEANVGMTPLLTGQGSDPSLEMRASRDGGKTWGAWRAAKLGAQGKYRQRTEKRVWGLFDSPGAMFDFRVTDPVPLRVSRVYANEPGGGRGRG